MSRGENSCPEGSHQDAGAQGGRGDAVEARQLPGQRGQEEGGRVLCEQHQPGAVNGGGGAGRHRQHDRLPEHVWLMGRQWGVLFEVRHLMLEPLEAPRCPFG